MMAVEIVDASGAEELGDHHVAAHRETGGHRHRQKHDGEGGAHGGHGVLTYEFAHHGGIHHVVELLKEVSRHHGQGKEEQQPQGLSFRQVLNHWCFLLP